jgi:hypothetical protein
VQVREVLGTKLPESETLQDQANNNTKEQFGASPPTRSLNHPA